MVENLNFSGENITSFENFLLILEELVMLFCIFIDNMLNYAEKKKLNKNQ